LHPFVFGLTKVRSCLFRGLVGDEKLPNYVVIKINQDYKDTGSLLNNRYNGTVGIQSYSQLMSKGCQLLSIGFRFHETILRRRARIPREMF